MSRSVLIACAVGALALGGCRGKSVNEMSYSEIRTLAAEINARCEAQGVKPSSPEWKICTQQETNREIAMREKNRRRGRAMARAMSNGMASMSAAYAPRPIAPRTSVSCHRYMNTVTCY